jgi:hypothetical protein
MRTINLILNTNLALMAMEILDCQVSAKQIAITAGISS